MHADPPQLSLVRAFTNPPVESAKVIHLQVTARVADLLVAQAPQGDTANP